MLQSNTKSFNHIRVTYFLYYFVLIYIFVLKCFLKLYFAYSYSFLCMKHIDRIMIVAIFFTFCIFTHFLRRCLAVYRRWLKNVVTLLKSSSLQFKSSLQCIIITISFNYFNYSEVRIRFYFNNLYLNKYIIYILFKKCNKFYL